MACPPRRLSYDPVEPVAARRSNKCTLVSSGNEVTKSLTEDAVSPASVALRLLSASSVSRMTAGAGADGAESNLRLLAALSDDDSVAE